MDRPEAMGPILIVEDDRNIASLVATYLEREGFNTIVAHDGEQGLQLARRHQPMFVVLDLMLPKVDGWAVCRQLRSYSDVPILMLTARGEEVDRVLGFALSADDYVVKPFSPRELVERVKAILRRTRSAGHPSRLPLVHENLVLDPDRQQVTLDGQPVELTPSEYRLLHILMTSRGRVFTRQQLLNHLQDRGQVVVERVIDVHVGKLRRKIEADASRPRFILTVRGTGYRFADPT
ncbi:MAG: response regulator transcription factor [Gammaproteobacteria bacterium]|nr:response regulator transcription factor [Gammaproteobacteria bacterium]MDJ0871526.1 response regulator transcription factor [Gammaproteobacteria bacterium]MDJ0889764.1 response regulator transcription factor [Gammaproteobacteria bacterium]